LSNKLLRTRRRNQWRDYTPMRIFLSRQLKNCGGWGMMCSPAMKA